MQCQSQIHHSWLQFYVPGNTAIGITVSRFTLGQGIKKLECVSIMDSLTHHWLSTGLRAPTLWFSFQPFIFEKLLPQQSKERRSKHHKWHRDELQVVMSRPSAWQLMGQVLNQP